MAYKVESPYKEIEIEAGERKIVLEADLSIEAITDFGARCERVMAEMNALKPQIAAAQNELDIKKMNALNAKAQMAVENACAAIVGQGGVQGYKETCFPGRKQVLKPMLSLIQVLEAVVKESGVKYRKEQELAAHYLSEAISAQTQPDPAA